MQIVHKYEFELHWPEWGAVLSEGKASWRAHHAYYSFKRVQKHPMDLFIVVNIKWNLFAKSNSDVYVQ